MRAEVKRSGFIVYELDENDRMWQAVEQLARMSAQTLTDEQAIQVGALFPRWAAGVEYQAGERIADEMGNLYKVVQGHTSQADWPLDSTPALYTPLGVTEEDPDAIPEWKQPTGAHDAYNKGDKVLYQGKTYVSLIDGNTYPPDTPGQLWEEVV